MYDASLWQPSVNVDTLRKRARLMKVFRSEGVEHRHSIDPIMLLSEVNKIQTSLMPKY